MVDNRVRQMTSDDDEEMGRSRRRASKSAGPRNGKAGQGENRRDDGRKMDFRKFFEMILEMWLRPCQIATITCSSALLLNHYIQSGQIRLDPFCILAYVAARKIN